MKPTLVLVDCYFLGKPYGFGRFIFELLYALRNIGEDLHIVGAVPDDCEERLLSDLPHIRWEKLPRANFAVWEQLSIPRLARKLNCDVIHFPYNTGAACTFGIPAVTTVHDLLFLHEATRSVPLKAVLASYYSSLCFRMVTARSKTVAAVSRTTSRLLRDRAVNSTVIYNTADHFVTQFPETPKIPDHRYLLHRGGKMEHRNTRRVLQAFALSRLPAQGVRLVVMGIPDGAGAFEPDLTRSVIFAQRLSDDELAGMYRNSSGVVAASLMEGFGLPIIEGFGFGVPVITSNIDPMREIAGEAAMIVDPFDVGEISAAMSKIVMDERARSDLVARGTERFTAFSSALVCRQYADLYRSAARREIS